MIAAQATGVACPICGAPHSTCKGANEPFVGRPLDLVARVERPEGSTVLRAKEQIWVSRNDGAGTEELLYNVGDPIREADALALGLITEDGQLVKAQAARGPRERASSTQASTGKVPRDKALRGPREQEE